MSARRSCASSAFASGAEAAQARGLLVPAERFPGLRERDLTRSIYALMRDAIRAHAGAPPSSDSSPCRAAHDARRSRSPRAPLMLVERIAYAAGGTPVEFARDRHRGDAARFEIRVVPDDLLDRAG